MRIEIKAIDPIAIRYETSGDWIWLPDGSLQVSVPNYGNNNDSAFLVALHEVVEAWQCRKAHIPEEDVSAFDIAHPELAEPGDSMDAPYHKQHLVATEVEKDVARALGIDWKEHEKWVENSADEVSRNIAIEAPKITLDGPRAWAELHLFALRHEARRQGVSAAAWFADWVADLPFDGCPCKGHLHEFLTHNPPDWDRFFAWSVNLHNAVNARIGKITIGLEQSRVLWSSRLF